MIYTLKAVQWIPDTKIEIKSMLLLLGMECLNNVPSLFIVLRTVYQLKIPKQKVKVYILVGVFEYITDIMYRNF